MERSNTVDWLRRARQFALGASVALVTTVLTVGCGSSSSSSTDSNGDDTQPPSGETDDTNGGGDSGTTPPPSGEVDTRDIAVLVADLANDLDFDYPGRLSDIKFACLGGEPIVPLSFDAGGSGDPSDTTWSTLRLTTDAGEISSQATVADYCVAGTVDITLTADGCEITFDQCQDADFDSFGLTYIIDGKTTYQGSLTLLESGGTLTYEALQTSLSNAGGDTVEIAVNGTIDEDVTEASVGAGTITLDLQENVSLACGGAEASGSTSEKLVSELANDGGRTIDGDQSFSFTDDAFGTISISVAIETVDPIRFEDALSDYPSSGKVNVTTSGQTSTIEFVQGGVLIDGVFVSWVDIEGDVDGNDFDSAFDKCSFF